MSTDPRLVSLYSFKGGAGRTVCTANLVGMLAKEVNATPDHPLLLMDMDLDSAGLTIFLDQFHTFKNSPWNAAKILTGELDLGIRRYYENFFSEGMVDVSAMVGADLGTVKFIGAEIIGRDGSVPVMGKAPERMQDLITYCGEHGVSTIVIDSASGRQETAVLCHMLSDVIVYCCRLTHQFLSGTEQQLMSFIERCESERGSVPSIIILPMAVPAEAGVWEERKRISMARISGLSNLTVGDKTPVHIMDPGVGEVESFKWLESVLATKKSLADDEKRAVEAYGALAKQLIVAMDGHL